MIEVDLLPTIKQLTFLPQFVIVTLWRVVLRALYSLHGFGETAFSLKSEIPKVIVTDIREIPYGYNWHHS